MSEKAESAWTIERATKQICKEVTVMVNGAIRKVVEDKKDFTGFAMAIPPAVKVITISHLKKEKELLDYEAEEITEKVAEHTKKEIVRFFKECNVNMKEYIESREKNA